jgi:hypothetical protein
VNLPGVILVGGFAFDYGCRLQGAFVNSHYFAADEQAFSSAALGALGWNAVDRPQKEKLAQIWVAKGLLGFLMVVSAKDDDFANHAFQPPRTVTRADGSIAVTLWVRLPSGRVRGTRYELREYRISSNGDFAGNTTLDNFTFTRN